MQFGNPNYLGANTLQDAKKFPLSVKMGKGSGESSVNLSKKGSLFCEEFQIYGRKVGLARKLLYKKIKRKGSGAPLNREEVSYEVLENERCRQ